VYSLIGCCQLKLHTRVNLRVALLLIIVPFFVSQVKYVLVSVKIWEKY